MIISFNELSKLDDIAHMVRFIISIHSLPYLGLVLSQFTFDKGSFRVFLLYEQQVIMYTQNLYVKVPAPAPAFQINSMDLPLWYNTLP